MVSRLLKAYGGGDWHTRLARSCRSLPCKPSSSAPRLLSQTLDRSDCNLTCLAQGSQFLLARAIWNEAPDLGSAEGDHPDLFRFVPISPFSSDLRSLFSGVPRFVPICSVFFRFVPLCFQNKSEQIRETPFCPPLLQIPHIGKATEEYQQTFLGT